MEKLLGNGCFIRIMNLVWFIRVGEPSPPPVRILYVDSVCVTRFKWYCSCFNHFAQLLNCFVCCFLFVPFFDAIALRFFSCVKYTILYYV